MEILDRCFFNIKGFLPPLLHHPLRHLTQTQTISKTALKAWKVFTRFFYLNIHSFCSSQRSTSASDWQVSDIVALLSKFSERFRGKMYVDFCVRKQRKKVKLLLKMSTWIFFENKWLAVFFKTYIIPRKLVTWTFSADFEWTLNSTILFFYFFVFYFILLICFFSVCLDGIFCNQCQNFVWGFYLILLTHDRDFLWHDIRVSFHNC